MEEFVKQSKNKGGNPAWKKGISGNPKGRPRKGESIAEKIRKALYEKSEYGINTNNEEEIIKTTVRQAIGGDDKAREFLINRGYGKVPDKLITHEDKDGLIVDINGEDEDDKERDDEEE